MMDKRTFQNSRLYADRIQALDYLPRGGVVVEVGVGYGDFSETLIEKLNPKKFIGIDAFGWEQVPLVWGKDPRNIFGGKSHEEYYRHRMSKISNASNLELEIKTGISWDKLMEISVVPTLIYLDAGHDFESVSKDISAIDKIMSDETILIFNDYCLIDSINLTRYGVVPVVNRLLETGDFDCLYMALEPMMFCDIAIKRRVE